MRKRLIFSVLVFLIPFFVSACGGGGGGGGSSSKDGNPPQPSVSVSIDFPANGSLIGGGTGITTVEGTVSSCSENEKIQLLIDSVLVADTTCTTNFSIDFDTSGLATGFHTLTAQVSSSSTSITVEIDPTELRKQALQFLSDNNASSDKAVRWEILPIVIEVSPEILQNVPITEVESAANFWTKYTGIQFEVQPGDANQVDPISGKTGVVYIQYGGCGGWDFGSWNAMECNWLNDDFSLRASIIGIKDGILASSSLLAHEIGHSLRIWSDVNDGTVTDHCGCSMRMSAVTAEAMQILYFELSAGSPITAD